MAVRLRLSRVGRKKLAAYRIVAADHRMPRDGRFIEIIGRYQPENPNKNEQIVVDAPKALDWLKKGAAPSETVAALLRRAGVLKAFHEHKVEQARLRKQAAPKA